MKILIVEDEEGLREALVSSLKDEGYQAEGAQDGQEGLDLACSGTYDLVILDIMLPKLDGYEVLKRIREKKIAIPVILLTARSELEDKVRGMDGGADDYLTKPFEMEELFARIRMVMRRQEGWGMDSRIRAGDLVLDPGSHEISKAREARRVKLGAKEYELCEYFCCNMGQVLSREQITQKVWGFDSEAEYNNVDVYVSFLRKKIQFVGVDVRIRSVRSVGYVLEETKK